jgi:amidase
LGVMTGVDPEDEATNKSEGRFERDYTRHLRRGALKSARIGIAREFMGKDAGTDLVVEQAIATLRTLGAVVIDPPSPLFDFGAGAEITDLRAVGASPRRRAARGRQ